MRKSRAIRDLRRLAYGSTVIVNDLLLREARRLSLVYIQSRVGIDAIRKRKRYLLQWLEIKRRETRVS